MPSPTPVNDFYDVCKRNGILLDTNMLILYIVGQSGEEAVKNEPLLHSAKHKHTWDDFKVVKQLVDISTTKQFFLLLFDTRSITSVRHGTKSSKIQNL